MNRKTYLRITSVIFGLVACLHAARLAFGWTVVVGTWVVPFWLSWGGLFGAGFLCIWGYREIGK